MKHKLLVESWRKYIKEDIELNPATQDNKFDSAHVVIQDRKGRVLVLKRSEQDEWMPGKWSLPGGGKREEENLLQGAIREVKEETGLDILPEDLVFLEKISQQQNHAFFLAKSFVGSVQLDSENSHFTWARPNQLIEKDCVPDLIPVLSAVVGMNEEKIPKDFEKKPFTNKLKGGEADNAKPEDFDPKKLRKGIEHETEHSSDIDQAKETAADHLLKYKHYYDELEKMEKKLEKDKDK